MAFDVVFYGDVLFDFETEFMELLLLLSIHNPRRPEAFLEVFQALPIKCVKLLGDFTVDGRLPRLVTGFSTAVVGLGSAGRAAVGYGHARRLVLYHARDFKL